MLDSFLSAAFESIFKSDQESYHESQESIDSNFYDDDLGCYVYAKPYYMQTITKVVDADTGYEFDNYYSDPEYLYVDSPRIICYYEYSHSANHELCEDDINASIRWSNPSLK